MVAATREFDLVPEGRPVVAKLGQPEPRPTTSSVLGVGVSAINMRQALKVIDGWIRRNERRYICIRDVHGVIRCQDDPELLAIHNEAGLVTPDGAPLQWFLRARGHRYAERVCGPDLMLEVFAASETAKYRHFLYGTDDETLRKLKDSLQARYPNAEIVGCYAPPFRPLESDEEREVADMINASGADIVWVGLSTPKQEKWMAAFRGKLNASVLIGVGAAFDFNAGLKQRAPELMQRLGLEWVYRLACEPKRLWKRYLNVIPRFLFGVFLQFSGLKRYPSHKQSRGTGEGALSSSARRPS